MSLAQDEILGSEAHETLSPGGAADYHGRRGITMGHTDTSYRLWANIGGMAWD